MTIEHAIEHFERSCVQGDSMQGIRRYVQQSGSLQTKGELLLCCPGFHTSSGMDHSHCEDITHHVGVMSAG